jgi:hypothetical protein
MSNRRLSKYWPKIYFRCFFSYKSTRGRLPMSTASNRAPKYNKYCLYCYSLLVILTEISSLFQLSSVPTLLCLPYAACDLIPYVLENFSIVHWRQSISLNVWRSFNRNKSRNAQVMRKQVKTSIDVTRIFLKNNFALF